MFFTPKDHFYARPLPKSEQVSPFDELLQCDAWACHAFAVYVPLMVGDETIMSKHYAAIGPLGDGKLYMPPL